MHPTHTHELQRRKPLRKNHGRAATSALRHRTGLQHARSGFDVRARNAIGQDLRLAAVVDADAAGIHGREPFAFAAPFPAADGSVLGLYAGDAAGAVGDLAGPRWGDDLRGGGRGRSDWRGIMECIRMGGGEGGTERNEKGTETQRTRDSFMGSHDTGKHDQVQERMGVRRSREHDEHLGPAPSAADGYAHENWQKRPSLLGTVLGKASTVFHIATNARLPGYASSCDQPRVYLVCYRVSKDATVR